MTWSAPATARRLATSLRHQQELSGSTPARYASQVRVGTVGKIASAGIPDVSECGTDSAEALIGDLLRCYRRSGLVFLILSSVWVARDDRGDALG